MRPNLLRNRNEGKECGRRQGYPGPRNLRLVRAGPDLRPTRGRSTATRHRIRHRRLEPTQDPAMSARSFLKGLRSTSSRCTTCGSDATYPFPGRLRMLARMAGLERYSCRACRGKFWLPLGVDGRHPHATPGASPIPAIAPAPVRAADLVAIDAAVAPPTAKPDTTHRTRRRRKRRR
jgi:hypothetical protein